MDMHKNAPLTPRRRAELVRRVVVEGHTPRAVATALGVCERTVRKRAARYRMEVEDRSSRPNRSPTRTAQAIEAQIAELRHRPDAPTRSCAARLFAKPPTVRVFIPTSRRRTWRPRRDGR